MSAKMVATDRSPPAGADLIRGEERVVYDPFAHLPGGFSQNDGTLDFYARINCLLRPEMIVLDLGAGRAAWFEDDQVPFRKAVRSLKGKVAHVIAADVDPIVRENRSADETRLIIGGRVPLDDESADMVICDYVLEHIADPAAFAAEIDRVLRPGGWFCARTPHKFNIVSIAARLVSNRRHASLLRRVQPDRKEQDVFPTAYRLNDLGSLRRRFAGYENWAFVFRGDPAYFFGRKPIYLISAFLARLLPASLSGNIFAFLRKPSA